MKPAYYSSTIDSFLATTDYEIVGKLNVAGTDFTSQWTITTTSWESSIQLLKKSLTELVNDNVKAKGWRILLEYSIPRIGKRIDAVLLADDIIFVIEYKYDRKRYELKDIHQVEDYALDLNSFHWESKDRIIIPMLLAPNANTIAEEFKSNADSLVQRCIKANKDTLFPLIKKVYKYFHKDENGYINSLNWEESDYNPSPSIIEAAKALFRGQKVENITKSSAVNLTDTSNYIVDVINNARHKNEKIICFVTGVPGAGKTLVGLNIVHENESFQGAEFNAAYFSGNTPLINVLRGALATDNYERKMEIYKSKRIGNKPRKSESERDILAKIQNLHLFIKEGIRKNVPPNERIVVFDEAQRCWDAKHFSNKAKQNRNRERDPFEIQEKSEAELLVEFMNRHNGWAVIIALVGGGQEINTGEGGIAEWGRALENKFQHWRIYVSPNLLVGDSSNAGQRLFESVSDKLDIVQNECLHLSNSERSFRASNLNEWVNALINNNPADAFRIAETIRAAYPLFVTRNIDLAKKWLRSKHIGSKRIGLVASSGGLRLKPYGINAREVVDEVMWFLNDEKDVRSSYYLEIAATEYKVQGLELDWVGICWDADLRRNDAVWDYKNFSGTKWQATNTIAERQFLLNTYRVLLTRAREGLIIFVPEGDMEDETRLPAFYDPTYRYLKSCGLEVL